jgi:hypothetical protein
MIPDEKKLVERMKDRPFALVGINTDPGAREALVKRLESEGITWRNAIDGPPGGPLARAWGVRSYPTIYVLDEKGVIQATDLRGDALDAKVEELVKKLDSKASH